MTEFALSGNHHRMRRTSRVRRAIGAGVFAAGFATGCAKDDLPELEWHGQRVSVGSNLGDEVCAGTLATLDREVEEVEAMLGVESSHTISVWFLDAESLGRHCPVEAKACLHDGAVVAGADGLRFTRHELVHAVLWPEMSGVKPLFAEGMATALGGPKSYDDGCLDDPDCATIELEALLAQSESPDLGIAGYYAAADLVQGMLDQHGTAAVLSFMAKVDFQMTPGEVRGLYAQTFDRDLDADFEAYKRDRFDDFTLAQLGCSYPLVPIDEDGAHLIASSDCSSDRVMNDFAVEYPGANSGIVRWRLVVESEWAGRLKFSGTPTAEDELLKVTRCEPASILAEERSERGPWWGWVSKPVGQELPILLEAGSYLVEWSAPLNVGRELDVSIAPPCSFEAQDCPSDQQCTIWNECWPSAPVRAELGEACDQVGDGPLVCMPGGRCVNGQCIAECDETQACLDGQVCGPTRVCGAPCSLLAPDCGVGISCVPTNDGELAASGTGQCIPAGTGGELDVCDIRENSCDEGLVCARLAVQELPADAPCRVPLDLSTGCCVPQCDPNAASPGCPDSVPRCDPVLDGLGGLCRTLANAP